MSVLPSAGDVVRRRERVRPLEIRLLDQDPLRPVPSLMHPPVWVGYLFEGRSAPVARGLAVRDALAECGRYVRQGRTRELLMILRAKARRRGWWR